MENTYKLISKYLKKKKWLFDGTQYVFRTAEWDESLMVCLIDCILPEKGQSYATPVFSGHIHDILSNIWKYVGSNFSYSEKILVNGKEPINKGIFISSEKQREVLFTMRKEVKEVTLRTAIGPLTFDIYWRPMEEFYYLDDVYIDFNFNIEISNFMFDSHYVVPNLKIADDVAGAILNVMYDTDYLRDEINNVLYDVMGNEIDIIGIDDLYYQARYFIIKMDGFEITQKWGNYYDLEPDMFT